MNWNEIKSKALKIATQSALKGAQFGFQSLEKLNLVLHTQADFDQILQKKRLLIVVAPFDPEQSKEILASYPVLAARCWKDMIDVRWIDAKNESIKFLELGATYPAVYRFSEGKFCFRIQEQKALRDFFLLGKEP